MQQNYRINKETVLAIGIVIVLISEKVQNKVQKKINSNTICSSSRRKSLLVYFEKMLKPRVWMKLDIRKKKNGKNIFLIVIKIMLVRMSLIRWVL